MEFIHGYKVTILPREASSECISRVCWHKGCVCASKAGMLWNNQENYLHLCSHFLKKSIFAWPLTWKLKANNYYHFIFQVKTRGKNAFS